MLRQGGLFLVIVGLALCLRLLWLDLKPAHFDEGVNGWFVDEMTRNGFYHYDSSNFHGPLHFYVLFVAQTLFGRDIEVLRLPIVLVNTACVALMFAFHRYLGFQACALAAAAMAISPGMVFYGRYAIHETWLVLFLMLSALGLLALYYERTRMALWTLALGITGMILTKETYLIHAIAFALAVPTLLLVERYSPSAPEPERPPRQWNSGDVAVCVATCGLLLVLFYTGGFLDWPNFQQPIGSIGSLFGLVESFIVWGHTGLRGESGHEKDWYYWLELLAHYEWPAALGLFLSPLVLKRGVNRSLRYLTIAACGTLVGYSIIAYKTPWCLLPIIWPLYFVLGKALVHGAGRVDRWITALIAVALLGGSLVVCARLNFRNYTDESEPYVYVQTYEDLQKLMHPLEWLVAQDPAYYHLEGHLLLPSHDLHPLPWLLGDFTRMGFGDDEQIPEKLDVGVLLVEDAVVSDVEERLRESYFKEPFLLRGSWGNSATLYLNTAVFAPLFPGRAADLVPQRDAGTDAPQEAEEAPSE